MGGAKKGNLKRKTVSFLIAAGTLISNEEQIRRNRKASIGNVLIETKRLVT